MEKVVLHYVLKPGSNFEVDGVGDDGMPDVELDDDDDDGNCELELDPNVEIKGVEPSEDEEVDGRMDVDPTDDVKVELDEIEVAEKPADDVV